MIFSRLAVSLFLIIAAGSLPFAAQAAYDSADATALKNLEIIRVTPDGEDVPAGKQIVIQFNRPVVPIGKMERESSEIPIITSPALQCEWRWINTSALACNLPDKAPLQEATHYTIDIKPGIEEGHIMRNHVHMLISIPPKYSVAHVVGYVKGKSSIWIAQNVERKIRNFTGAM